MDKFVPQNLDPMSEVIQRVRSLEKPNMKDVDCQAMEKRFCDQDWMTQLAMYETWLDADNGYMLNTLFRFLCAGYWDLLQDLITEKKSEKANALAERIKQCSIKHIRMQIIAYFVTTYMPIDVVRKYRKVLSRYLEAAYCSLALRLGGDEDFHIDKERLVTRLSYYTICDKFNLPTTDEEALIDFKLFMESYWMQLSFDYPQDVYEKTLKMSLLQCAAIRDWYATIKNLGLNRMVKAFDRFDGMLQEQISSKFKEDVSCIDFPGLPMERQYQYWYHFRNMANEQIISGGNPERTMDNLLKANLGLVGIVSQFDLQIEDLLSLEL